MEKIKELIVKGFKVTHANLPLVLTMFIYNIILAVLALVIIGKTQVAVTPGPEAAATGVKAMIYGLLSLLLWIFVQGGLLNYLKEAVPAETGKDLGLLFEGGQKYYIRILILTLLLVVPLIVLIASLVGMGAVAGGAGSAIAAILGIILIIIMIAYFVFLFLAMFSSYGVVIDEKAPIQAIKDSIALVAANFWITLLVLLCFILIGLGIGFVVGLAMGILNVLFKGVPFMLIIIDVVFRSALNAYIIIIVTAAFMSYYLSLTGAKTGIQAPKA